MTATTLNLLRDIIGITPLFWPLTWHTDAPDSSDTFCRWSAMPLPEPRLLRSQARTWIHACEAASCPFMRRPRGRMTL